MIKGVTVVWAVDSGAYDNNYINWIFSSEAEAKKYAAQMNAIEEKIAAQNGGYRSMDSSYDVRSYKLANSCETAAAEDARLDALYKIDKEAWQKEL
jgi:hypothetical protein